MVLELRKLSEDEKIRQQAEARADYDSRIATAKSAGYKNGKEDALAEVYCKCIAIGMSKEEAIAISGVSEERITNL